MSYEFWVVLPLAACGVIWFATKLHHIMGILKSIANKKLDVDVNLLNTSSETTEVPVPKGSLDCSHTWEKVTEQMLETHDEKKLVLVQVCKLCGLVDKTIEKVVKEKPKSECRHTWAKNEVKMPSPFQQAEESIRRNYGGWSKKDLREVEPWFYKTTYILTMTCTACGEVKTVIASNINSERGCNHEE